MVTIYWCFKDADAEQNIGVSMDRAWETWTRKLGLASQANRHALQVKRWITPNTNLYPYCYDEGNNWDPTIPPETVVVKWTPSMQGGQAWTGYIANDNTPGRHILERGNGPPGVDNDWVQAHELGHVLGLHHEHQRLDRNNYISYNPENVVGYEDAVRRAAADGVTVGELVNLEEVGRRYNWIGFAYAMVPQAQDFQTPYDYNSIMHYDCSVAANPDKWRANPTDPRNYPIMKINQEHTQVLFLPLNGHRPYPHFEISVQDAATIRAMYPWIA
jgi:hypothetical protein